MPGKLQRKESSGAEGPNEGFRETGIMAKDDPGQAHLLERIESRNGLLTVEASAKLGFGSREYELIEL